MTNEEIKNWRKSLNLTQAEAAERLGVTRRGYQMYEAGVRNDDGRPVIIPKYIALACAAISAGLE